ncbi:MAG: indolepyruvate ferredoxin oxidoreductase subunit alpha [Rhodospirillales bacterium]|nr:indolepyruvate ferredoxin oxidoreductase subunit alpha [Rhodospirillales bacterium]
MDHQVKLSTDKKSTNATQRPMTGNEALARGAWEAGVKVGSAYPGTPSTEIMESLSRFPSEDVAAQWATNEKVACDVAIGASFAGVRAMTSMKHVGLNVASDALMSVTYIGVNGGLVLVVCDDPGIHSSQNEQDSRIFAKFAMVPCLEPSDAQEALDFTKLAFDLSEEFDTPVIVRSTTRLSHTRSAVKLGQRVERESKGFVDNPSKNVMMPNNARIAHPQLIEREEKLAEYFNTSDINKWEKGRKDIGIITMATSYAYVKETIPEASILKLGASYPLPAKLITDFCESVERVFIVEELEPFVENDIKVLGLSVEGKKYFPRVGEFSPEIVRLGLENAGVLAKRDLPPTHDQRPTPRPPVLCAGCPHTAGYMAIRAMNGRVMGDIGCYTLAAVEPLRSIDTCVSMGSSIGNAIGIAKAGLETKPIIATIGDSTFLHAGIPALIDAVYNDVDITVILLDNHITAMTGGQNHAATGKNLRGDETHRIDFEKLISAVGVKWVRKTDSYDIAAMYQTFREAAEYKGVSVVISDRPCVLDPVKVKGPTLTVISENCVACQSCMNLGCPALSWSDEWYDGHHKVKIDGEACIGCTLCAQVCPADSIRPLEVEVH